ncbi:unnamed protein product, partial [Rotaria sp. Silwood1]
FYQLKCTCNHQQEQQQQQQQQPQPQLETVFEPESRLNCLKYLD